jgi:hypothetical protein
MPRRSNQAASRLSLPPHHISRPAQPLPRIHPERDRVPQLTIAPNGFGRAQTPGAIRARRITMRPQVRHCRSVAAAALRAPASRSAACIGACAHDRPEHPDPWKSHERIGDIAATRCRWHRTIAMPPRRQPPGAGWPRRSHGRSRRRRAACPVNGHPAASSTAAAVRRWDDRSVGHLSRS